MLSFVQLSFFKEARQVERWCPLMGVSEEGSQTEERKPEIKSGNLVYLKQDIADKKPVLARNFSGAGRVVGVSGGVVEVEVAKKINVLASDLSLDPFVR